MTAFGFRTAGALFAGTPFKSGEQGRNEAQGEQNRGQAICKRLLQLSPE
jgi:hypothetical protein